MSEHRYILEPYKGLKTRYTCPECNKPRKFARYIDTETNEHLGDRVGKCERSDRCGWHYTPKQHFADTGTAPESSKGASSVVKRDPEPPISYIDSVVLRQSLADYNRNNFVSYLHSLFDADTVRELIRKYKIGTSKHWPGSTVFWQIDVPGNIRTGKIMQYDSATGKRIKVPYERIQWVHKVTKAKDFNLKQCLFGEHLLFSNKLPVAVVESEKTAIIASAYLPQFTWVAAGNKQGLGIEKCKTLKANSETVILYPDLNAFNDWTDKARLYGFKVSDLLEKKATEQEKENGLDLADYLIRFDVKEFLSAPTTKQPDKGFSTIIQDKGSAADSTKKDFLTVTTRAEVITIPQPDDTQLSQSPIPADVIGLQQFYSNLEEAGLIPDAHRSYIDTLWQGVLIYLKNPIQLPLYTEPLQKLRIEIESSNKKQIAV